MGDWPRRVQPAREPDQLALDLRGELVVLEHRDLRRFPLEAVLLPPPRDELVRALRELGPFGKGLDVLVVHAGVDQRLRAPRPDLRWVQARVEEGAPGLAQDVDRLR